MNYIGMPRSLFNLIENRDFHLPFAFQSILNRLQKLISYFMLTPFYPVEVEIDGPMALFSSTLIAGH
jgi:hypothetical protein